MSKTRKKRVLGILGIVVFYVAFVLYSDARQFYYHWTNLNLAYVPLILGIQFLALMLRVVRQKMLFESLGIQMSMRTNTAVHFAGLSLVMTPGGFGQVIKSYYIKNKYGHSFTKTIPVSLFERYHDLLAVVSVLIIALAFSNSLVTQITVGILSVLLLAIYIIIRIRRIFQLMINKLPKRGILAKLPENTSNLYDVTFTLTAKRIFLLSWIIGTISVLLGALGFYLSFAAFGIRYDFFDATIASYVPIVLGSISFLPGGIGVTEVNMTGLLVKSGMELSIAYSIVFFTRLTTVWFFTIIGLISTKFAISNKGFHDNTTH